MADKKKQTVHSLRDGNSVGRIRTDGSGNNVWEWSESDLAHGSTTALIRTLDNDELTLVVSPVGGPTEKGAEQAPDDRERNRYGRKVDKNGGFDPYS